MKSKLRNENRRLIVGILASASALFLTTGCLDLSFEKPLVGKTETNLEPSAQDPNPPQTSNLEEPQPYQPTPPPAASPPPTNLPAQIDERVCALSISDPFTAMDVGLNAKNFALNPATNRLYNYTASPGQPATRIKKNDAGSVWRVTENYLEPTQDEYSAFSILDFATGKEKFPAVRLPIGKVVEIENLGELFMAISSHVDSSSIHIISDTGVVLKSTSISQFTAAKIVTKNDVIVVAGEKCKKVQGINYSLCDGGVYYQMFDKSLNPLTDAQTVASDTGYISKLDHLEFSGDLVAIAHTGNKGAYGVNYSRSKQLSFYNSLGQLVKHHSYIENFQPSQTITLPQSRVAFNGGKYLYCTFNYRTEQIPIEPIHCRMFGQNGENLSQDWFDGSPLEWSPDFELSAMGQGFLLLSKSRHGTGRLAPRLAEFTIIDRNGTSRLNATARLILPLTASIDLRFSDWLGSSAIISAVEGIVVNNKYNYGLANREISCK